MIRRETFICDCHSLEHQFSIWYGEDDNQIFFETHLINSGNWYQRFWGRLKYLLGHTSRFGAWDEMILNNDDVPRLKNVLDEIEQIEINNVADRGRD